MRRASSLPPLLPLLLLLPVALARNGYSLSYTGKHQLAGTRRLAFDTSNPEIAKMQDGFTLMLWARFHDMTPNTFQPTIQLGLSTDGNFMQPFGGLMGGYEFTSNAKATVSTTADNGATWHHYAIAWDRASGAVAHYVDGTLLGTDTMSAGHAFMDASTVYSVMGMNCYPDTYLATGAHTDCNENHRLNGDLDDVAFFGTVLDADGISARWNASLTDRQIAGDEPDLVIFWDFDDPLSSPGFAPNRGTAGADYDLAIGALPKDCVFADEFTSGGLAPAPILAPVLVPASDSLGWPRPKARSATAPLVLMASPGEALSVSSYGATWSGTVPDPLTSTHVVSTTDDAGDALEIHLVPRVAPIVPASGSSRLTLVTGLEDAVLPIQVWAIPASGSATLTITVLPTSGTLYDIGADATSTSRDTPITAPGQALASSSTTAYVLYVPQTDAFGAPLDSFSYSATDGALTSSEATITITIEGDNDSPSVNSSSLSLVEDEHAEGVLIDLVGIDAESGTPLELMITKVPTRGTLYQTENGTLSGARTPIDRVYNSFEVGDTIGQYLDHVISVSSFWGKPPQANYHPLTILGPPDCTAYGECAQDGDWVYDTSAYPPVGQKLMHSSLIAFVTAVDEAADQLTVEYHPMYKEEPPGSGTLVQCVIDPDASSQSYPDDCSLDLASFASFNATSGRLSKTISRSDVAPIAAAGWSPLNKGYVGAGVMTGGGAFGPEYVYSHDQSAHYVGNTPYTEYIEVGIAEAVYPVLIEVGSPRGMGHLVAVKVLDPSGEWVSLYTGAALTDVQAHHARTQKYWYWAPQACRTHFKTSTLRLEVDTSAATGVSDWNYIDYVRVFGARSLQPAALPLGTRQLVYVPHEHAHGSDSFEYRASDCPGNLFRYSEIGHVAIDITAVNDPPTSESTYVTVETDVQAIVPLSYADIDNDVDSLTVRIIAVDASVQVSETPSSAPIVQFPHVLSHPSNVTVTSKDQLGNATVAFSVTDAAGLVSVGFLVITVAPRPAKDQTTLLIAIIAVLGGLILIIGLLVLWRSVRFIRAAIKGRKLHEAAKRERVRRAVSAAVTMQSSCYLISYAKLKAMGGLQPHEVARDQSLLTAVDNYDDLVQMVNNYPIIFFSHQWLSWEHPDPDKKQYHEMIAACEEICVAKKFDVEECYVFLDYLSIPQKNINLRLMAINTLGIFSSLAPYFVVIAPDDVHRDTKKVVNKASYQRRGWCRLEQWGHMCMQGMNNMYFFDHGKLHDLDDNPESDGGTDWFLESILVFDGDYTNPENKPEMVDVVLGLYAMVVDRMEGTTQQLYDLIKAHHSQVFPVEFFHDMPALLVEMLKNDHEARSMVHSKRQAISLEYAQLEGARRHTVRRRSSLSTPANPPPQENGGAKPEDTQASSTNGSLTIVTQPGKPSVVEDRDKLTA